MSAYTDQIDHHPFHTHLNSVHGELEAISSMSDITSSDAEAIARISLVIKNFELAAESCEKNLISLSWLNEAASAISNIASYLNSFRSSRDNTYLSNHAFGQLDILLQCSVRLNCVRSRQSLKGVTEALNVYTQVIDSHNEELFNKVESLNSKIADLENSISEQKQLAKDSTNDFQSQLHVEKQRLDNLAGSYQSQMAAD